MTDYMSRSTLQPAVLITIMFFLSGISKIQGFDPIVKGFMDKTGLGVNIAKLAIVAAGLLQLVGPGIIVYESYTETGQYRKHARIACFALAAFTVLATLIYHFPPIGSTYYPFISNVTTFGGLLLLADQFRPIA